MSHIPLEPGNYYHIYNHANGNDKLFTIEVNYSYFLRKYTDYMSSSIDTLSYCLMSNHFHLLIQVKDCSDPKGFDSHSTLISKQFSNFFNAYTKAFNKQESRMGSLFNTPFKRKQITSEEQLRNTILYIHSNPVHHGFTRKIHEWKHSSYHDLVSEKETMLKREEVITLFDDADNFIYCHASAEKMNFEEIDFNL